MQNIDIIADSPVNNAKMREPNKDFKTFSSQVDSENIYDAALNGSPRKQNSQSPVTRVSTCPHVSLFYDHLGNKDVRIKFQTSLIKNPKY